MSIRDKITSGMKPRAQKVIIYGPPGVGKTTLASQFPDPLFFDLEGGTSQLDVRRIPGEHLPTLSAFESAIAEVASGVLPCSTLVVDQLGCMEQMAADEVVSASFPRDNGKTIEDAGGGFGRGYVALQNRLIRTLGCLGDVISSGRNVVLIGHSCITKFPPPDGRAEFNRYDLRCISQGAKNSTSGLLSAWCDIMCFLNFRTQIAESGPAKNPKFRGVGGTERMMYSTRCDAWEAKNRNGMPESAELSIDVFRDAFLRVGAPWGAVASPSSPAPSSPAPESAPPERDEFAELDQLEALLEPHEDAVNEWLRHFGQNGGEIGAEQTFRDVSPKFRKAILANADRFLTKVAATIIPQ